MRPEECILKTVLLIKPFIYINVLILKLLGIRLNYHYEYLSLLIPKMYRLDSGLTRKPAKLK